MSLLNLWVQPTEAIVAVDTDAVSEDGRSMQTSKLYSFAHLAAVFAARGASVFHDCLSLQVHLSKVQSYDELIDRLPELIELAEAVAQPHLGLFPERFVNRGQEIVFAGWSHKRSRMLGWLFRKVDDMTHWQEGEVKYFHAPPSSVAKGIPCEPAAVEMLAAAQVRYMKEVCGFGGGTLIVCRVTETEVAFTNTMRFSELPQQAATA